MMGVWETLGKSDDWRTPKYIFDALECQFDLDVASPGLGRSYVPTAVHLVASSLEREWSGFIWMNPPFGGRNGLEPWLEKFFIHGNGIALVPDRTSAPWFQRAAKRANALLFVSPRIRFERPDGTLGKSPSCGTVLMSAGRRGRDALLGATSLGLIAIPQK